MSSRGTGGSVTAAATALRRCVLAVGVLGDLDVLPGTTGVQVGDVLVPWLDIAEVVGEEDPLSPAARRRVERLLRLHAVVGAAGADAADVVARAARVVALPRGHADHLGPSWAAGRLLGGALDLGLGVLGLLDDPDQVVPLPDSVARACSLPREAVGALAMQHVQEMGRLAASRLARDGALSASVIRPVGGCDVLTLLVSRPLRAWLANSDGSGLRAVAVPMRTRGWFDLAHIDPAFVGAAWSATAEQDRGVAVALLVTLDEVGTGRADPRLGVRAPRRPW